MDQSLPKAEQDKSADQSVKEKYLAVAFLSGLDKLRYGKLLEDIEKDSTIIR
jgi:hypothetical protein